MTAPNVAMWAASLWSLCLLHGSLTVAAFSVTRITVSPAPGLDVRLGSVGVSLSAKSSIAPDDPAPVADARPLSSLPARSKRRKAGKKRKQSAAAAAALQDVDDTDIHMSQFLFGSTTLFRKMKLEGTVAAATEPAGSKVATTTPAPPGPPHLDGRPVLVLNADYQPVSILPLSLWHWQEAIKAVCAGKVTVVDVYPDVTIRSVRAALRLPSVIALREYVPMHRRTTAPHRAPLREATPAFSKRNVFLRDGFRCQYCRRRFGGNDLSLDHVLPRCRGGRLEWTNAVACCRPCNNRKGAQTLSELERDTGMRLARPPVAPTTFELARNAAGLLAARRLHDTWRPYLGVLQEAAPEEADGGLGDRNQLSMAQVLVQD